MDEMYVQGFEFGGGLCRALGECELVRPENLVPEAAAGLLAGNVFAVYAGRLPASLATFAQAEALPTATALLRLAPQLAAAGQCVSADLALPLYVRDKVALTTEERERVKAAKLLAEAPPLSP
jgi:tRNA threonylcarbamoyladenosine biosynthesis protein TsaB